MRPIDADAIIEVMKKCAENPENAQALLCYRYAQRILEEAPTVEPSPPWHRVEEPPKEHMWCFVYTDEPEMIMPIRIAFYVASCTGKGSWYHYESGEDIDDEVDYWTPMYLEGPDLPWPIEPPKEDEE